MEKVESSAYSKDCQVRSELMESNNGTRFLCFVTGVGIGALVGVLFAPHSGKRTRELIADQTGESRDYLFRKGKECWLTSATT